MAERPFYDPRDRPSRWAVNLVRFSAGAAALALTLLLLSLLWP